MGHWIVAALLGSTSACAHAEPAPDANVLRVATYNILAGDRGLKGLAATLREVNAELVGLQEVDRNTRRSGGTDQPGELSRALRMRQAFVRHFPYQGGDFGLTLLSRYPIRDVVRHEVPGSRQALLEAKVDTPRGTVRVLVVHFSVTFVMSPKADAARADAARLSEAKETLALATEGDLPTLVLGDFNDDTGSPPYELMASRLQDACSGALWAKTWSSSFPVTRIDYVFASRHFSVRSCHTHASQASDHLPVVAEVVLNGR